MQRLSWHNVKNHQSNNHRHHHGSWHIPTKWESFSSKCNHQSHQNVIKMSRQDGAKELLLPPSIKVLIDLVAQTKIIMMMTVMAMTGTKNNGNDRN